MPQCNMSMIQATCPLQPALQSPDSIDDIKIKGNCHSIDLVLLAGQILSVSQTSEDLYFELTCHTTAWEIFKFFVKEKCSVIYTSDVRCSHITCHLNIFLH